MRLLRIVRMRRALPEDGGLAALQTLRQPAVFIFKSGVVGTHQDSQACAQK